MSTEADPTHIRDALEQNRLLARALREPERTHGLGALVFVRGEEVIQARVPYVLHKPLAVAQSQKVESTSIKQGGDQRIMTKPVAGLGTEESFPSRPTNGTYMYGPGSPFSALKHRQVSSTRTGPPTWGFRQIQVSRDSLIYSRGEAGGARSTSGEEECIIIPAPPRPGTWRS